MAWNPTNANDVTLIISRVIRDDSGTRERSEQITDTNAVVVDDFSLESEENMEALSGVGNAEALGISRGDIEHSFSFTVQGEDADLFNGIVSDEGRAVELEIIAKMDEYKDKFTGAYIGTRNISGSSGDPIEGEFEGIATGRPTGTV